jgi:TrpR-related protein YerC/YecD
MKHRNPRLLDRPGAKSPRLSEAFGPLLEALLTLRTPGEMRAFLEDLCTPAELEAIADRWRVVPLLVQETPYREIHDRTGVSVTTIARIARCLSFGAGGYRLAVGRVLRGAGSRRKSK